MRHVLLPVFVASLLTWAAPTVAFEIAPSDLNSFRADTEGESSLGYSHTTSTGSPALSYNFRIDTQDDPDAVSPLSDTEAPSALVQFGVDTRFERRGMAISFGAGVASLTLDQNITDAPDGTALYPTLSAEIDRSFDVRPDWQVRPFVSAESGVETLLRVGADVSFASDVPGHSTGSLGNLLRRQGIELQLRADLAGVSESAYLERLSPEMSDSLRARAQAGLYRESTRGSQFLGVSVGGEGRAEQSALVGAVSLDFNF